MDADAIAATETVTDALERYLEHAETYQGLSLTTIVAYGRDGGRFCQFLERQGLDRNVTCITRQHIQGWANSMAGHAPATIRRRVYAIRALFSFLQREGTIQVNPAAGVSLPKRRRRQPHVPDRQQCMALLAAAHTTRDKAVISLLLMAGLRRAELLGLDAEDVSADGSELRVVGKGEVERLVPLPEDARAALLRHIETADIRSGPVFRNRAARRMGNTTLQRLWRRLLRRADLADEGFTLHSCRHAYATLLVRSGSDIGTVQQLLGHSDLSTTGAYLHSDLRTKRDAVANLPIGQGLDAGDAGATSEPQEGR